MKQDIKKTITFIPTAYNSKALDDIYGLMEYYKKTFDVYLVSDKYKKEKICKNFITYVKPKSNLAKYLYATSDYIIDAGTISNRKLNVAQKRISVWHGIPYKNMFVKLGAQELYDSIKYEYVYDLMISPSKFYTNDFLRDSMLYKGEILETAIPKTDNLFISETKRNELFDEFNIPKNKKIILYAPTFRKEGAFILPFSTKKIQKELGEEYIILVKLHYLNHLSKKPNNIIDCTKHSSITELMSIADILITDYSSTFFDFSVLKKSIVFYQYDKEKYFSERGTMFDLEKYIDKKYIVTNEEKLYNAILDATKEVNSTKIQKTFYPNQVKKSSIVLAKQINLSDKKRNIKEVIFLVNELNQIGGVHSFITNLAKELKKHYNCKVILIGLKEFGYIKDNYYFDKENIFDVKLTAEKEKKLTKAILNTTNGYIIACQFSSFMKFQSDLKNKNTILMFHGDTKDIVNKNIYTWHLNSLNQKKIYNYKKLLLLTKGNATKLKKKLSVDISKKVSYIPNSLNFSDSKSLFKKTGEFAYISRLSNDKNIWDLIKIFSSTKINPKYKVHVYGDGPLNKKFQDKIKKEKLTKKIILHGYCSNKEEMFNNKEGLIMTSLTEGFPIIILEAYKYNIPVYSYNSFTAAEDIIHSKVGKLIETGNIEQYVKKLNEGFKILNNKAFEEKRNTFSNEIILNKWINLFDSLENEKTLNGSTKVVLKVKLKQIINESRQTLKKRIKKALRFLVRINKTRTINIKIMLEYFVFIICNYFRTRKYKDVISIVVPFYNNNKTLNATLKSIEKNGYKNYEVILINDGSKEDPKNIYSKYKNIKYFYKENEGLGFTRNFGISKATGKYVFFLDSDDTINKGSLLYLLDYAKRNKLSVVSGRTRRIFVNTNLSHIWYKKIYNNNKIITEKNKHLIYEDTLSTNKLYNLNALKESSILYEKGLYEDKLFISLIYNHFDRIGIVKKYIYNWLIYGNNTSITTSLSMNNIDERIKKMTTIFNNIEENDKKYYINYNIKHDFMIYINNYINYTEKEKEKIYNDYKKYVRAKEQYIYYEDIHNPITLQLLKYVLDNDYKNFKELSEYKSKYEKYLQDNELKNI